MSATETHTYNPIEERDRLVACVSGKVATPEAFAEWLEAQADDAFVGRSGEPWACPIHNFLHDSCNPPEVDRQDFAWIHVYGRGIGVGRVYGRRLTAPPWVGRFVSLIDDYMQKKRRKRVRKSDATEMLRKTLTELAVTNAGEAA